jgi:hypothetical protein
LSNAAEQLHRGHKHGAPRWGAAALLKISERFMPPVHRWSVTLASPRNRRPRWLDEDGHFSSDPSRALRLVSPEVAVQRIQAFLALHGNKAERIERFRLVPAPTCQPVAIDQIRAA